LSSDTLQKDIVTANGNDMAPQPLAIYYNRIHQGLPAFVSKAVTPEWISTNLGHHGHLAAGDIDANGLVDIAVGILIGHPAEIRNEELAKYPPGGFDVYRGIVACPDGSHGDPTCETRPTINPTPDVTVREGFGVLTVAFGDADGNGWLDLAVGAAYESKIPVRLKRNKLQPGPIRIYLNRGGELDLSDPWTSSGKYHVGTLKYADVDLDGLLDLVVGTDRVLVFRGMMTKDGPSIERKPSWQSKVTHDLAHVVVSVDTTPAMTSTDDGYTGQTIVASYSCLEGQECDGRYVTYLPFTGVTGPTWQSSWSGWGGGVSFGDLNGDTLVDMATSAWFDSADGKPGFKPSVVRVYQGSEEDEFGGAPIWTSSERYRFVGQAIELADTSCGHVEQKQQVFTAAEGQHTFTLTHHNVEVIIGVTVGQSGQQARMLTPGQYAVAIGEPWVSIPNVDVGDIVTVHFTWSPEQDIVVNSWDYNHGVFLFESKRTHYYRRDCNGIQDE